MRWDWRFIVFRRNSKKLYPEADYSRQETLRDASPALGLTWRETKKGLSHFESAILWKWPAGPHGPDIWAQAVLMAFVGLIQVVNALFV